MDPQTNQIAQTQTQISDTAQTTFSAQVAKEDVLGSAAFEKNSSVLAAHKRSTVYRLMWLILAFLLFGVIGAFLYFSLRGGGVSKTATPANDFNVSRVNLNGFDAGVLTNGQLTVNGDVNIVNNLNVGGDANIGGTLSATTLQGNLNATNIVGSLQPAQLDPFIAYVNKDNQAFFGTNQIFRNASNSTAGFQVQNASSAPILTVNTISNYLAVNESAASQPNLTFETNGNGRFAGSLQVGLQSNPNTSILHTGSLFNNDIQRVLTVQEEISNNNVAGRIYTGLSNELLVNPQFNPNLVSAGGQNNIFAGSYSAVEIAQGNAFNFGIVGGNLNALTHSGSGQLTVGVSNFSTITNRGPGDIVYAVGNLAAPALTGTGNIGLYSGFTALDPESPIFNLLGTPNLMTGSGTLLQQVGVQIDPQHSGISNYNLASLGLAQNNAIEGRLQIGYCSNVLTTVLLYNCGNPSAQVTAPFSPANPLIGGNKLEVNRSSIADANAVVQVNSTLATDKPLVVQGVAGQTGALTQWQDSSGAVLSSFSSNGRLAVATNSVGTNTVLAVNTNLGFGGQTLDNNTAVQINSGGGTLKGLVVQGSAFGSGNLQEWQAFNGAAQSAVTSNGSFGIGTATPGAFKLNVTDTATVNVSQFNGAAATQCTVVTGVGWSCSSDENLKTNILSVSNGLDVISQLRGVTFNWKADADAGQQDGFIAQEVQKVLPQLVTTDANGHLSLNKDGILPYLVNAIQQQQTQITALQNAGQVANGVFDGGIVSGDTEFNGKAIFNALTTHNAEVVFAKNATFERAIVGSSSNRGRVTVAAGSTTAVVTLSGTHTGSPNVQLTPLSQIDGVYWVSGSGPTSFTIHLEKPQTDSVLLNWLVID